ncbi:phenylacetate--CoA ligase family protein [Planctomycetota bacterium]
MATIRKYLFAGALRLAGRPVFRHFETLKALEYRSPEDLQDMQDQRLRDLLLYAYRQVPYYHDVLSDAGVVVNEQVQLERFNAIPLLSKEVIRAQGDRLSAEDPLCRHTYYNSSGGSTGEPVILRQDRDYQDWGLAGRFLYNEWAGKAVGEPELKLWGSERDILQGQDDWKTRLRRWLFNTEILNAYRMSEDDMRKHIERWNQVKPSMVWAYTDSMYWLSRFVREQQLDVHAPNGIICTTAPLLEEARQHIETTFGCKVFNQYGSREVGTISSECAEQQGLHIFSSLQKIEILDAQGQLVPDGQPGEIVITNLTNHAMPLIRYRIGDTGSLASGACACGRGFPRLKDVTGRVFAHFLKRDGGVVHSQFFVALFFFKPWLREFKVVQKDYDVIEVLIVRRAEPDQQDLDIVVGKIKHVMGPDCRVDFTYVDDIAPTQSGKFFYTECHIKMSQE